MGQKLTVQIFSTASHTEQPGDMQGTAKLGSCQN